MKKLFLLLILSFFSAQGFAGSCPDGSEPVKSISDDGTYFVYNCGGSNNNSETNPSFSSEQIVKLPYDVPLNYFHVADVMDINDDGIDDVLLLPQIYPNGQLSAEIREKLRVREANGQWYLTKEEAMSLKPTRSVVLLSSKKGYVASSLPDSSKSRNSWAGKFILSGDKKYIYLGINDESGHDLIGTLGLSVLYEIETDSSKIKIISEKLADYETSPSSIETIDLDCDGEVEILENNFRHFSIHKKKRYNRSIFIDLEGDITGQNYSLSGLTLNNAYNELEFFDVDQNGVLDVLVAAEVWIYEGNPSNKQPGSYILFNPVEFDNKDSNQSILYFPKPAYGKAHAGMSIAGTIQDGTQYFFEQSSKWGVFNWNKFKLYQYDKNNHKIVDVTKLIKGDFSIGDDTHPSLYTMDVDFDGDLEIGFKKTTSSAEYFDWNGNEFILKQFNQMNTSEQHSTHLLRDINNQCVMSLDILDVNTDSGVAKISSCQSLKSEKLVSLESDIQFNQTLSCKDIAKKI